MNEPVPFIVFEDTVVRLERTIKKLWILCIIIFIACVVSNGCWIYYESQWEYVSTQTEQTVTQDNDGGSNTFVGGDLYGYAESKDGN